MRLHQCECNYWSMLVEHCFQLSFLPFQAYDGTVSQLRQYLVEMERFDAVSLVDQAMEEVREREDTATDSEENASIQRNAQGTEFSLYCFQVGYLY